MSSGKMGSSSFLRWNSPSFTNSLLFTKSKDSSQITVYPAHTKINLKINWKRHDRPFSFLCNIKFKNLPTLQQVAGKNTWQSVPLLINNDSNYLSFFFFSGLQSHSKYDLYDLIVHYRIFSNSMQDRWSESILAGTAIKYGHIFRTETVHRQSAFANVSANMRANTSKC